MGGIEKEENEVGEFCDQGIEGRLSSNNFRNPKFPNSKIDFSK
jgi:hypothetical protein